MKMIRFTLKKIVLFNLLNETIEIFCGQNMSLVYKKNVKYRQKIKEIFYRKNSFEAIKTTLNSFKSLYIYVKFCLLYASNVICHLKFLRLGNKLTKKA